MTTTVEHRTLTQAELAAARGLSIKQPYAFSIAEGFKTIENRTRSTRYRGPLFIHASQPLLRTLPIARYSRAAALRLDELGGSTNFWDARKHIPSKEVATPHPTLARSAVIATARLTGCHRASNGCCAPWGFPEMWHWELADVQPLRQAVPRAGALGLWKTDAALAAAVAEAT